MPFVLDNSIVMRWLFSNGSQDAVDYAIRIFEQLNQEDQIACVPAIWSLEVGNVIVRAEA